MIGLFDDNGNRLAISYNGLTFNQAGSTGADDIIEVNRISPRTQFTSLSDPNPTGTGTQVSDSRKTARIIRLDGVVRALTFAALFDKLKSLASTFDPDLLSHANSSSIGFLALDFSTPTADLTNYPSGLVPSRYYVRPRGLVEPVIGEYSGIALTWAVELFLKDPRRYSQSQSTLAGAGTADNSLADFRSWPTVTITMAGAGSATFAIARTHATFGTKTLTLDLSGCVNTDVVVVDFENMKITKNGTETPSLYVSGDYWEMEPGSNTIAITNGTNATVSTAWRRAWCA